MNYASTIDIVLLKSGVPYVHAIPSSADVYFRIDRASFLLYNLENTRRKTWTM